MTSKELGIIKFEEKWRVNMDWFVSYFSNSTTSSGRVLGVTLSTGTLLDIGLKVFSVSELSKAHVSIFLDMAHNSLLVVFSSLISSS